MLSFTRSEGTYAGDDDSGTIDADLTTLYPYVRHALSERTSVWGLVGYGEGSLGIADSDGPSLQRSDIDFRMGAIGVRSLLSDPDDSSFVLSTKADALVARTTSDGLSGAGGTVAASDQSVSRVRLGVDAAAPLAVAHSVTLTPSVGLALRHDAGDAETGLGVDLGAGLALAAPVHGVTADLRWRSLLAHADEDFSRSSLSGSIGFDPDPLTLRGASLSLTRQVPLGPDLDPDGVFSARSELISGSDAGARLELRMGYGFSALSGLYTAVPEVAVARSGDTSELRFGSRLVDGVFGRRLALDAGASVRASSSGVSQREYALGLSHRLGAPRSARRAPLVDVRFGISRIEGETDDVRASAAVRARW